MKSISALEGSSISRTFFCYFIPAATGMLVKSLYYVVDGIFVGHGIGTLGLAGFSLACPLYSVPVTLGLLFGMGGSVTASNEIGAGNIEEGRRIFSFSMVMIFLVSLISWFAGMWALDNGLVEVLGATEATAPYARDYISVFIMLSPFFFMETALTTFVRNDGSPKLAMFADLFSSCLNCFLDWLFIFRFGWGMSGAALATGIGWIIASSICLVHFFRKKGVLRLVRFSPDWGSLKRIIANGVPSSSGEFYVGAIIMVFNIVLVRISGDMAVAAYFVISTMATQVMMVQFGLGQAIQPMVSYYNGAAEDDKISQVISVATKAALASGCIAVIVVLFFGKSLIQLFMAGEAPDMVLRGLLIYFSCFLFSGFNVVTATYFQSIERPALSTFIFFLRGFLLVLIALALLVPVFGIDGVWLAVPVAELITVPVGFIPMRTALKRLSLKNIKLVHDSK